MRKRIIAVIGVALSATAGTVAAGCGSSGGTEPPAGQTSSAAPVTGDYSVSIDPANFGGRIDNPYFPLRPGTTLRYEGVAEDGKTPQTNVVEVTDATKRILGVDATVVLDTVSTRGTPVERTHDWYAQDKDGNVWYLGEDSFDYKNGHFVKSTGSWEAGVDGAQPGILMETHPRSGDAYRQEYYPGHALDQAMVLAGGGAVTVPSGTYRNTVVTEEKTALEPGIRERKWYAPGIGEVRSQSVAGEKASSELVSVTRP
jgi:hypothetical protein